MKIIGESNLNSNAYNFISIFKDIKVYSLKKEDAVMTSREITHELNGKSELEIIEGVIRYFIENHSIAFIYTKADEFIINSISNISLRMSKKYKLSDKLFNDIYLKYYFDRMNIYSNSDVDSYIISSTGFFTKSEKSYNVKEDNDKLSMSILLSSNDKFDKSFLDSILEDFTDIRFERDMENGYLLFKCKRNNKDVDLIVDIDLWVFLSKIYKKIDKEEKVKSKNLQFRIGEM